MFKSIIKKYMFQVPHYFSGDITEYSVLRTWEFSSPKPVRSIIFPYLLTVVPALIVRLLATLECTVSSYLLLVLPRILMCISSFLQDVCIYKICVIIKVNPQPSLLVFASSYVTFTYFTRTFSNSLESILFALFLFLIFKSLKLRQKLVGNGNRCIRQLTFYSFMCGIVLVLGCFIRPTFICFSLFPMIVWFYKFCKITTNAKFSIFNSFMLGAFSMGICLTAIDSLYYSCFFIKTISSQYNKTVEFSINKFQIILTPVNFIFYNLNPSNLSSHGLHSRWLHIAINIPLLFSVYGLFMLFCLVKRCGYLLYRLSMNFEMLLLLSFLTPLVLLSVIPHQEPRFIIPLIIPLSLLYGKQPLKSYLTNKFCIYIWISSNLCGLLFYGFIHQAGVYLSINHLNNIIENNNAIVFYKTYMPPRYLLSLNEKSKNVGVFDFAGLDLDEFESRIQNIINNNKPSKFYIVLPYKILDTDLTFEALTVSGFKFAQKVHFFPHLSTENLPSFLNILHILQKNSSFQSNLSEFMELFSIHIITFERYFS